MMQKALHLRTTVLPGGRIEIVDQELREGDSVDVVVTPSVPTPHRSALDILEEAPWETPFRYRRRGGLLHPGRARIVGPLTLPESGPIYLDACAFIYSVERIEPYRTCSNQCGGRLRRDGSQLRAVSWWCWKRSLNRCARPTRFFKG